MKSRANKILLNVVTFLSLTLVVMLISRCGTSNSATTINAKVVGGTM